MTDPCWLPSAIMQTTTALLGFYAVVYALMIKKARIERYEHLNFLLFMGFNVSFITFLGFSIATICLNVLWLDRLSVNVLNWEISQIGFYAIMSFFMTLLIMLVYTVLMIVMMGWLGKINPILSTLMDKAEKHPKDLTKNEKDILIYLGISEETLKELGVEIGDKKKVTSKQKERAAKKE